MVGRKVAHSQCLLFNLVVNRCISAMSTSAVTSNLDSSAAEFVPDKELLLKIAKREGLAKTKEVICTLFSGEKAFQNVVDLVSSLGRLCKSAGPSEQRISLALAGGTLSSQWSPSLTHSDIMRVNVIPVKAFWS